MDIKDLFKNTYVIIAIAFFCCSVCFSGETLGLVFICLTVVFVILGINEVKKKKNSDNKDNK